jgi:hypothetical protein
LRGVVRAGLQSIGASSEVIERLFSQIGDNPDILTQFRNDLRDGKLDAKNLVELLKSVQNIELNVSATLTVEELEDKVMGAFSDIDFAFATMTQQIELDFAMGTNLSGKNVVNDEMKSLLAGLKADPNLKLTGTDFINVTELDKIIRDAQDRISSLNFKIDDLEAGLKDIEEQEEEINKTFDDRLKALDKVAKLNESIARQQRAQLSVADALSQGDIAAAARAVQSARAEEAQASIEKQRESLDAAREIALDGIRNRAGQSRKDIESAIKELKDQIFEIEEKTLEPANRALEIANLQKQNAIDSLDYLGKNKLAWDAVKNGVEMAKIEAESYKQKIRDAIDLIEELKRAWASVVPPALNLGGSGGGGSGGSSSSSTGSGGSGGSASQGSSSGTSAASSQKPLIPTGGSLMGNITIAPTTAAEKSTKTPAQTKTLGTIAKATNVNTAVALSNRITPTGALRVTADTAAALIKNAAPKITSGGGGGAGPMRLASGGAVKYLRQGGMLPYKSNGGSIFKALGSDTVPAMLTPGEFVVSRPAVRGFGVDKLKAINSGTYNSDSVYNYSLNINVKSDASANEIANTVMTQIKRVDAMRMRGNRF